MGKVFYSDAFYVTTFHWPNENINENNNTRVRV